ncbi:flagellar basal body rod protein FlgG [Desulfuribacillus alkaliarsenatis]|uniref:Flagellar basal-body rod protein FlgF n=1 Tax=Desulfuribacillus alkaliarsenatis TaxID=766136 RepID=A0A1E5G629_9FIRM|nr:flagellar basal body rod protein FlgG [Desulfuribacillus alkaliarsenatis]OEF98613.1 flagellar basal-body rod protein FlgF [Desulfuribacillus alkaliarsenatis]
MLRSLYSGVSGMQGFQTKLDVIGNNIANVNTVGFKASRVMFQDVLSQRIAGATIPEDGERGGRNPVQVGLGVGVAAIDTLHTEGSPQTTGVGTDLYINGDGYFAVQDGADGEILLTRAGNFTLDALGFLVTADGYFVLDEGGEPIQLEDEVESFSIGANGLITTIDGEGEQGEAGIIGLVTVRNPMGLEKVGGTKFRITGNADEEIEPQIGAPGEERRGFLVAGRLEMSNVELTSEFTEMIITQRGFQANSRIITTSDEILQEVVNLKR